MNRVNFIYRGFRFIIQSVRNWLSNTLSYVLMKVNLVSLGSGFSCIGVPKLIIHTEGRLSIGNNFKMNNTVPSNPIGRNYQCLFRVDRGALLQIGHNVGISGTAIICHKEIIISDNVKIGGNTCIYDTDFHSLNPNDRNSSDMDVENTVKKSVFIGKNVFIGAHVTILKGVHIGENSIIGACSVLTKSVPENEIWAGNPAMCIGMIDEN